MLVKFVTEVTSYSAYHRLQFQISLVMPLQTPVMTDVQCFCDFAGSE